MTLKIFGMSMTRAQLIPANMAMIIWKKKKHQTDFDLKVYHRQKEEPHQYSSKFWPCSSGCVYPHWKTMTCELMFAECMKILFMEGVSNKEKVKKAIFEFGKIKELESMRMMYHALYLVQQMPYEGLIESVYAWDFCTGE